jgi:hypothetical protein
VTQTGKGNDVLVGSHSYWFVVVLEFCWNRVVTWKLVYG